MASLVEELITTMDSEKDIYSKLIEVAKEKTEAIVSDNLELLQSVTDQENAHMDMLNSLEAKRTNVVENIGVVLNKKPENLTLVRIIDILSKQPQEQKRLKTIHDELKGLARQLKGRTGDGVVCGDVCGQNSGDFEFHFWRSQIGRAHV